MPVKKRQIENPVIEEIEIRPSASMLDDIVTFYHETMEDPDEPIEQRLAAARQLTELGKYGFTVDPIFASSTMYNSSAS